MAYAGEKLTIPLGQLGLMPDAAPTDVALGALIYAQNIVLNEGRCQKAPGDRAFNSVALPGSVVGVIDWRPDVVTQHLVAACSDGFLYIDRGVGSSEFSTTPLNETALTGLNPNCQFIVAGGETPNNAKKLFFLSRGQNQIQVLSAGETEVAAISNPATDWASGNFPKCGALHRNHLFVFSNQQAYMSDTGDHEKFNAGDFGSQLVFPGEGGDIIAAFVYKGRLFCFKEDSFGYWLDDSSTDSDEWIWKKLTSNFGISATNALTEVIDDLVSGNDIGTLTSYQAVQSFGDVKAGDVLSMASVENYFRAHSSKAGVPVQHVLYYPEKKLLFATYRSMYLTYNDSLLVVDVNKAGNPKIMHWKKGRPQCLALRKDGNGIKRPMFGHTDGKVYFMDQEDRISGGSAYRAEFQTGHIDCSQVNGAFRDQNKQFDYLSVTYVPEGNFNLSCEYFIDGKYIDTITFPMNQFTRPRLNTLTLGTDRLAQKNSETVTRELTGSGRTISFRFYNEGLNQSFQVCSITMGFRPAGEKAQKTE